MEKNSAFKNTYRIGLSDVDFTKRLKLSTLLGYFQEAASMHADNLGIGVDAIEKSYGIAWILIRIRVDVMEYPVWNDEISIETWHLKTKKFEFQRDFLVRDSKGRIVIRAVSSWVILDLKTRELKKTELLDINYPPGTEERAIDCRLGKLKAFGQPEFAYKKVIGYSDIDINGHLNNSRYVDFAMDCFTVEAHRRYFIKSMQVSYVNEALPGDSIVFYRDISSLNSNLIYIEGISEKNDAVIFKAQAEIDETVHS